MPDDATTPRTADPAPDGDTLPPDVLPGTGPGDQEDGVGLEEDVVRADPPRPEQQADVPRPAASGVREGEVAERPEVPPPGDAGSTLTAGSPTVSTLTTGTLATDAAAGARADVPTAVGSDTTPGATSDARAVPSDGGGLDRADVAAPADAPADPAADAPADPAAARPMTPGAERPVTPGADPGDVAVTVPGGGASSGDDPAPPAGPAAPPVAGEPTAEGADEHGQRAARHALPEPDTHAGFFERTDGTDGADSGAGAAAPPSRALARARLGGAMRPRISRGQLLAAALCALLGFALVVQVRQTQEQGLESLRQTDLVNVLDNVTRESQRLEDDSAALQETLDRLSSGSGNSQAAQEAARQRLEVLGILVGTLPAQGKGIELVIDDPRGEVNASVLLDTLQELRDAGAEAVQIGNVRVVASTSFVDVPEGVRVDGTVLERPFRMKVIGDPQTLSSALDIPGGVLEVLRQKGAEGRIAKPETVTIDALRAVRPPQYARPAPDQAP